MAYFYTQKSKFGKFWEGFSKEVVGNFMEIWPILQPLGLIHGHLAYFSPFW
jgi:hypothetical protein